MVPWTLNYRGSTVYNNIHNYMHQYIIVKPSKVWTYIQTSVTDMRLKHTDVSTVEAANSED